MVHRTVDEERARTEVALECAQAIGDAYWESRFRRMLYDLLLVNAPVECDLVSTEGSTTPAPSQAACQWPLRDASGVATLMEQVQAMPSGQNWLEVTVGKLMVPACPTGLGQASFKQQLGEAIQNHENVLAVQEGRKARKFNYSRWIFRA